MKKIIFVAIVALLLFSCEEEPEETGPFSLIGTWMAEGEFKGYGGSTYSCKITLIFLDETNFEQETKYVNNSIPYKPKGTYTRTDENIIYKTLDSNGTTYSNTYTYKYHFVNKNTLETLAVGIAPEFNDKATFKRKN